MKLNYQPVSIVDTESSFTKGISDRNSLIHDLNILFHKACQNNNFDEIESLLKQGADIHSWDEDALAQAFSNNNITLVNWLLAHGANIHKRKVFSYAINSAYKFKSYEIIDILINNFVQFTPNNCESILSMSSDIDDQPFVEYLFNIFKESSLSYRDLLYCAVMNRDIKRLESIFNMGAKLSDVDNEILQYAFRRNQFEILKYFSNKGINIYFEHNLWLKLACNSGIDCLKSMIDIGFNVNKIGDELVEHASQYNEADCVKFLIFECGLNLTEKAICNFCLNHNFKFIEYFIRHSKNKKATHTMLFKVVFDSLKLDVIKERNKHIRNKIDSFLLSRTKYVYVKLIMLLLKDGSDYQQFANDIFLAIILFGRINQVRELCDKYGFNNSNMVNQGLNYAAAFGKKNVAEYLIKKGADISRKSYSPLRIASRYCKLNMVNFLIHKGAKPSLAGLNMSFPVFQKRGIAVVKLLIKHGANIHENQEEAMRSACLNGNIRIVKYLVKQGANLSIIYPETLIEPTCRGGHLDILKYLVDKKVDININFFKSLNSAIYYKHFEIAHYLLSQIKDLYTVLWTVIIYACYHSSLALIHMLLERGISIKEIEWEALHYCLHYNKLNFADKLINLGFNIHVNNDELFQNICLQGDIDKLRYLLKKGVNLHAGDENGLKLACEMGLLNVATFLVQEGADFHVNNEEPLRLACLAKEYFVHPDRAGLTKSIKANEHLAVVKFLVEKGADIHKDNEAALLASCSGLNAKLEIVQYLVTKGANVNLVKDQLLSILKENGNHDIYPYLLGIIKKNNLH